MTADRTPGGFLKQEVCRCADMDLRFSIQPYAVIPPKIVCADCLRPAPQGIIDLATRMYEWGFRIGKEAAKSDIKAALGL